MIGIERFAGLEHAEAQVQQFAHRSSDDLLGLEPALVLQALAQGGHQRVPAERGKGREVEGRAQGSVADPGDPGRRIERGARLPMAGIEVIRALENEQDDRAKVNSLFGSLNS